MTPSVGRELPENPGRGARDPLQPYLFAATSVSLAAFVRLALDPWLTDKLPFTVFFLAVVATCWYARFWPAAFATLLSAAAANFFFIEPRYHFSLHNVSSLAALQTVSFVTIGLVVSAFGESLHQARVAAQARFRQVGSILEGMTDGFLEIDRDWRIVGVNSVAESLGQLRRKEILGKDFWLQFPDARESQDQLHRVMTERATTAFQYFAKRTNQWFEVKCCPSEDGGIAIFFQDVTERRLSADRLEAQRRWLNLTLKSIGDAVIATDADARVAFMNAVAEELTGWPSDEAVGKPLVDVFRIVNEVTRQPCEDPCQQVLRTGRTVGLANHTILLGRDGREWPIADSAAPLKDAGGKPLGVVLVFRDVTDERRSQENYERLAAIVEHSNDAIIGKNLQGIITSWNVAAEHLYGYSAQEAIGQPISMIVPPDRREELKGITAAIHRGERVDHLETVRVRKDGSTVEVSLTISPIRNEYGEVIGASKITRDISDRHKAEEAMRINEQRLRLALDAGSLGVWDWEIPTGRLTWSERVYQVHGVDPAKFGGDVSEFQRLVHPDDAARVQRAIQEALADDATPYDIEFRIIQPSGQQRWLYTSGRVLRNSRGEPTRMLGATIDTTDRKTAEENSRFLAEASKTVSSLVDVSSAMQRLAKASIPYFADASAVYLPEQGQIRLAAHAHRDPDSHQILAELNEHYPPTWETPADLVRVLRDGVPRLRESMTPDYLDPIAIDDRQRQLFAALDVGSFVIVPLESRGRVIGAMAFMRSKNSARYNQDSLALANDIAQRAATAIDNCRLYDELKAADKQKDDFLAMLAHELRNPLAAISYANELSQFEDEDDGEPASVIIDRHVKQLSHLIDDLLDVSRITQNKIQLKKEPIDAAEIVKRAVTTVRPLLDEHKHRLTVETSDQPMPLFVDATRIAQVLVNLLANAAKYTPDGGQIAVKASAEGATAVIQVRDNGIGISPPMLPQVFALFTQVDPTLARSQGGLGIGLTVARRLTEMHGGALEAASEGVGKGSQFTVRLPLAREPVTTASPAEPRTPLPTGMKVLVVDDNVDTARSASLLLQKQGFDTRTAHDGHAAIEAADEFRPDAMVLDIGLPGMDGYQVAQQVRKHPDLCHTHLIAVSGYGQQSDVERSKEAGFDDHLTKPINFAKLLKSLGRH